MAGAVRGDGARVPLPQPPVAGAHLPAAPALRVDAGRAGRRRAAPCSRRSTTSTAITSCRAASRRSGTAQSPRPRRAVEEVGDDHPQAGPPVLAAPALQPRGQVDRGAGGRGRSAARRAAARSRARAATRPGRGGWTAVPSRRAGRRRAGCRPVGERAHRGHRPRPRGRASPSARCRSPCSPSRRPAPRSPARARRPSPRTCGSPVRAVTAQSIRRTSSWPGRYGRAASGSPPGPSRSPACSPGRKPSSRRRTAMSSTRSARSAGRRSAELGRHRRVAAAGRSCRVLPTSGLAGRARPAAAAPRRRPGPPAPAGRPRRPARRC